MILTKFLTILWLNIFPNMITELEGEITSNISATA